MRKTRLIGIAVAVVVAMTAVTAVAAAHEFKSTGTGALSVTRNQVQKFKTKFGNVNCNTVKVHSQVTSLSSEDLHATLLYSGCSGPGGTGATVTPALYLFLANGEVHVLNSIFISDTTLCEITVKPQLIWTVKFNNTGKEVEVEPKVTSIAYEGKGTLCSGTAKDGTYEGTTVVGLAGQTIEWK